MKTSILKFLRDERGATAIEYGIIAGLMAAALIVGLNGATAGTGVLGKLKSAFSYIATQLASVA
jgi:pilus assembly protein Flp/PilA